MEPGVLQIVDSTIHETTRHTREVNTVNINNLLSVIKSPENLITP
jgi:hypothetical protein